MAAIETAAAPDPIAGAGGDNAKRDGRGRWVAGRSGNPAGKPPGTKNRATLRKQWLRGGEEGRAMRTIIEKALSGNVGAARWVMDGIAPRPRGRPIDLDLPADASGRQRVRRTVDLMCAGEISPDEARQMVWLLHNAPSEAVETVPATATPHVAPQAAPPPESDLNFQVTRAAARDAVTRFLDRERADGPRVKRPGGGPVQPPGRPTTSQIGAG